MAAQLHYLTVQDILWINLQVTGKVNHFSFAKLEEATYYQYAYGDSKNLLSQAARFLPGFLRMSPIESGNEATAFIGLLAFLKINGMAVELHAGNALTWFQSVSQKKSNPLDAIQSLVKPISDHHSENPDVRKTIKDLIGDYSDLLQKL